jgi:hypothetical protein
VREAEQGTDAEVAWRAIFAEVQEYLDEECSYDHHGYCQSHGLSERPCFMERGRSLAGVEEEGGAGAN